MEHRYGQLQNLCCLDLIPLSQQSIENIMDGNNYQRGSIEKDGNRQRDSATIHDEEITISWTSYRT